ncbi:MAG: hypothetical protein KKF22_04260 [Gammaproteobacteria bacterium]|nr:hypothetical protein [Gammaproteobacteria bacterium]
MFSLPFLRWLLCCLLNSLALLLAPALASLLFPWVLMPVLAAELSLSLWMIIKGVNRQKWQQSSQTAS